jgi:hypothetical protein
LQIFYFPVLHKLITNDKVPPFVIQSLGSATEAKTQSNRDTLGAISHILQSVSPQRSVISAVSHTESFLQFLAARVFRDHHQKLSVQQEQASREEKLLDIILSSTSKSDMIDRIIEERVRALFYGAPADFFLKDKAKLEFGDYFKANCKPAIDLYVEVSARRNLLIHNDGRVDRKYIRETKNTHARLREKLPIDTSYLRAALFTLRGLAATAGVLVCNRVYKNDVQRGLMWERHISFKRR